MSRHGSDGMVSARSVELACTAKSVEKCQLFIIIFFFCSRTNHERCIFFVAPWPERLISMLLRARASIETSFNST